MTEAGSMKGYGGEGEVCSQTGRAVLISTMGDYCRREQGFEIHGKPFS